MTEVGSGTRRRPIGRDYAAVKDAEGGGRKTEGGNRLISEVGMRKSEKANTES
jgi:hypothetical protein